MIGPFTLVLFVEIIKELLDKRTPKEPGPWTGAQNDNGMGKPVFIHTPYRRSRFWLFLCPSVGSQRNFNSKGARSETERYLMRSGLEQGRKADLGASFLLYWSTPAVSGFD
jgi:hypothetical protein